MEDVAKSLAENTAATKEIIERQKIYAAMQLRAYLTVVGTDATFQERDRNIAFEARASLINNGNTPAHKVSYWARSDVLPNPLPAEFTFPPPSSHHDGHDAVLGAHNNFIINGIMTVEEGNPGDTAFEKKFVDDADVADIKAGNKRSFYTWGAVTYQDEFGTFHATKFCLQYIWVATAQGEVVRSYYNQRHNEAD